MQPINCVTCVYGYNLGIMFLCSLNFDYTAFVCGFSVNKFYNEEPVPCKPNIIQMNCVEKLGESVINVYSVTCICY